MHRLTKLDKLIKRRVLAKELDTHYVYLCNLMSKSRLSEDMDKKVQAATRRLIRQLEKTLK